MITTQIKNSYEIFNDWFGYLPLPHNHSFKNTKQDYNSYNYDVIKNFMFKN